MEKKFFNKETVIFAHRGASNEYPENTLPAFQKAVELGVDVIETDVHLTKDNRFVIFHDETIDRMCDSCGLIRDYTLSELKTFNAGYRYTADNGKSFPFRDKGLSALSLEEVLEKFPEQRFNIDLKDKSPEQGKLFVDIINKHGAQGRVLAASEHRYILMEIRRLCPELATSFALWEALWFYFLFKSGLLFLNISFPGDALQVPEYWGQFHVVTGSFIKQAHEKGLKVHVWTINKESDMRRLLGMGADGVMSDNPELLLKVVESLSKQKE